MSIFRKKKVDPFKALINTIKKDYISDVDWGKKIIYYDAWERGFFGTDTSVYRVIFFFEDTVDSKKIKSLATEYAIFVYDNKKVTKKIINIVAQSFHQNVNVTELKDEILKTYGLILELIFFYIRHDGNVKFTEI